jgi:hypothetical protein
MPTEMTNHTQEGFQFAEVPVSDVLAGKYDELDPQCVGLIENSIDRMPWRLYIHQPYSVSDGYAVADGSTGQRDEQRFSAMPPIQ